MQKIGWWVAVFVGAIWWLLNFIGTLQTAKDLHLSSLSKLPIWQLLSRYQLQQRIPKQELILAVVKAMLQFVQISVQMLKAQLVICLTT
jgi:hypothetical protein